jgi:hypothetical protein
MSHVLILVQVVLLLWGFFVTVLAGELLQQASLLVMNGLGRTREESALNQTLAIR